MAFSLPGWSAAEAARATAVMRRLVMGQPPPRGRLPLPPLQCSLCRIGAAG
jgi:hypothetical protein